MSRPQTKLTACPQDYQDPIPTIFFWTKMGTEAGQPLDTILRRKELERRAGGGLFAWGIGNSLGVAPKLAQEARQGAVDVLFTPMKSAAKHIDAAPAQVLLWLGYFDDHGRVARLPSHMVITSRGNSAHAGGKRSHYALICDADHDITRPLEEGVVDASRARNFVSLNPLGASQVTAVVRYESSRDDARESFYPVAFRAKAHGTGFVRLARPVVLGAQLAHLYSELCDAGTTDEWLKGAEQLRRAAEEAACGEGAQGQLFGGENAGTIGTGQGEQEASFYSLKRLRA